MEIGKHLCQTIKMFGKLREPIVKALGGSDSKGIISDKFTSSRECTNSEQLSLSEEEKALFIEYIANKERLFGISR